MLFIKHVFAVLTVALALVPARASAPGSGENRRTEQRDSQSVYLARNAACTKESRRCDWDRDGLITQAERKFKTDPFKKDSDRDGIRDGDEDNDGNGISNEDENDSRCRDIDTDSDGLSDEDENDFKTKPRDSDTDGDGILDGNDDANGNQIADEDEDDAYNLCTKEDVDDDLGETGTPVPERTPDSLPTVRPTATPIFPRQTPEPTPTRIPPTPTSTPAGPTGNVCDDNRNTAGFGIPSGLLGRGAIGRSLWTSSCQGCHGPNKKGAQYPVVYGSRNRAEMAGVKTLLSNTQNSADITADRVCP